MGVYEKLKEMNLTLPQAPAKGGIYSPLKRFGNGLAYISGCGPNIGDETYTGKLGAEYTVEQGQQAARNCILNVLAVAEANLGSLDKIKTIAKITVFVAGKDTFYEQPQVANGGSQLLLDLFGQEKGAPSRSAVGMNALPGNIPVEIEMLLEVEE